MVIDSNCCIKIDHFPYVDLLKIQELLKFCPRYKHARYCLHVHK